MSNVIPFPKLKKDMGYFIDDSETVTIPEEWPYTVAGVPVIPPTTGKEFLDLCKRFLEPDDYTDMLVAIMDEEAYSGMEVELKTLVDHYYGFIRN